ncbi:hypothetical protein [Flavobacterium sp. NKUCC04_CG]|uniref:hypothetical protein n=1 Tax=Flavobacterium sp. NKUCC04_CG TaxID=2842121 RepID=UPI001C5AC56B|nr:hypothetical protein [Flavobacterium sp. NKUCC04_CG]MBW3517892.1 hypothetical protein [Flavobacterium sp. NKUCC04_CG]
MIDIFKELSDYNKYFESQLALSGTILGLIIATSTFILQSGFASFQYSRSMFIKYYVHQSKFIFLSLAYNILFSLIVLYLSISSTTLFSFHIIFALIFSKYFLDFYSHKGYIETIHSTKYNPYKNGILKYFRYIENLGYIQNIIIYATLYIIFFYPLHFNYAFKLNEHQVFMTTVSCLAFSTLVVIRIIPQFFTFSEQEYKSKTKNEVIDNIEVDLSKENEILKDVLVKNGRNELLEQIETENFDSLFINMPNNKKEAFFVINIEISDKNIYEIIKEIENYSYEFLIEISNIHIDTNSFVLSYFIKIKNDTKTRNYFIRTNRNEIDELRKKNNKPKDFINNISNKLIDELFRNI